MRADLHIHTALSPCASQEMTPAAIVGTAIEMGLDMIAVCDHNSAGNTAAVRKAAARMAEGRGIAVIDGMEITTLEEVHVLGLFRDNTAACAVTEKVLSTLPLFDGGSRGSHPVLQEQVLFGENGKTHGFELRILSAATAFGLSESVEIIKRSGGLAIASHVDRPSFGVLSQLGLFPADSGLDALELSAAGVRAGRMDEFASIGLPLVSFSDSHSLFEIGASCTLFEIREPTFDELVLALGGLAGRGFRIA
ncbi:MAG TPA: PHP domain-containing protein [Spirochaetia bacterium]|nr:PHP domain-containing protein [Spirochaetia bacterium]